MIQTDNTNEIQLMDCVNELEEIMRDLESDIQRNDEKKDNIRVEVLKQQYLNALESRAILLALYNGFKGGKNEVFYPSA